MAHGGRLEFQGLLRGVRGGQSSIKRSESLAQHGGGQEPEHISQPFIHECSPNHTRWGGFINVKAVVIIRNFLISGFGADISAMPAYQTGELSISRLSTLIY